MEAKAPITDGDHWLNPDEIDRLEKARKAGIREVVELLDIDFLIQAIGRGMHNTKHEKPRNQAREQMQRLKQLKEWGIE